MANFNEAFDFLLTLEGGFTNDQDDSGGPTNLGITQKELSAFLGHPATIDEVKMITKKTAGEIYLKNYWSPSHNEIISEIFATIIFCHGVNCGIKTSIHDLQEVLNQPPHSKNLKKDGIFGPKTLEALNALLLDFDQNFFLKLTFIIQIQKRYMQIVINHPKNQKFLLGWLARTHKYLEII